MTGQITSRRSVLTAAAGIALTLSGAGRAVAQGGTPEGTPRGGEEGGCLEAAPVASPAANAEATSAALPAATPSAERCVTIEMYDIYFEPNVVTLPADTPVTLAFTNEGAAVHNFSVTDHGNPDLPNLNVSFDVQPGEARRVTLQAPAGRYYFYCDIPGHEQAGMVGYLDVKADAEIATETATVTPVTGG